MPNLHNLRVKTLFESMLIFLGVGFLGLGIETAQAAPPSAYDMFKPASFFGAEMSPSGRYLATVRSTLEKVCLDKYGQTATAKKQNCNEEKNPTVQFTM